MSETPDMVFSQVMYPILKKFYIFTSKLKVHLNFRRHYFFFFEFCLQKDQILQLGCVHCDLKR